MNLKQQAAARALDYVRSGTALGLGTGATTTYFVEMLGEKLQTSVLQDITGVPTSEGTAALARKLGIPLTTISENPDLDLAVDGADEVDPSLNLIKGLGRAALREKIVEIHARRLVIIVDDTKLVQRLGRGPMPVEIARFGAEVHVAWLNTLGCRAELWLETDGSPIITDNGNYLVRCWFENGISDAYELAQTLSNRPGVIEHGLFLDMAHEVIVAGSDGISVLTR